MVHLMLMRFTTKKTTFFGNSTVIEKPRESQSVIEARSYKLAKIVRAFWLVKKL